MSNNLIATLLTLPKLLHDIADQVHASVSKLSDASGIDGKVEAVASIAESASTAIEGNSAAILSVGALAGAPGEAAAAAVIAAAPVVSTVAAAVEDAFAKPISDTTPMGQIWGYIDRIDQIAADVFGIGNGDNAAVQGALTAFKEALSAHPANAS